MHRSGGARPGQDTSPIEFPWIVQLLYSGSDRQCAGSIISDRHVLTARRCVDKAGPNERSDAVFEAKDISVLYGTRQKYGGEMNVKTVRTYDAKLAKGAAADLAVLELEKAVEFSNVARPICLANTFDEKTQNTVFGLHFGKKRPEDEEVNRPLYFDVLYALDKKNCEKSLGRRFHKDEFCVSKRNEVFVESISIGAPIMTPNNAGGRWVQVGIALEATKENNYGNGFWRGQPPVGAQGVSELHYHYYNNYDHDAFHDNNDDDIYHYNDDPDYNRTPGPVETGPGRNEEG
ncbi:Collagenase precursor [Aphelenchoides avenae]|nr:Collagenase precursor [Aphelenchus avenae]